MFCDKFCEKQRQEKIRLLDKIHGLSPLKFSIFWPLFKLQFFGLKIIVFFYKYPETIFSDVISVKNADKKKFDFWTKPWTNPFKKCPVFGPC